MKQIKFLSHQNSLNSHSEKKKVVEATELYFCRRSVGVHALRFKRRIRYSAAKSNACTIKIQTHKRNQQRQQQKKKLSRVDTEGLSLLVVVVAQRRNHTFTHEYLLHTYSLIRSLCTE